MRKKLGECLVQAGVVAEDDLRRALAERKRTGERLGIVLVRMELATEEQIAEALSFQLGFPYVTLAEHPADPAAVVLIPKEVALKRVCIAIGAEKNVLTVAMSDPLLFSLVHDLESRTGHRIRQVVATRSDIIDAINVAYPEALTTAAAETVLARPVEDDTFPAAPVGAIVDLVVKRGIDSQASDIHIEPMEKRVLIRHRLDGVLNEVMDLPRSAHEGVIARLKIMAGLDAVETRLPQDGRLRVTSEEGSDIDFRVSTLRTVWGEKMVLRVLNQLKAVPGLEEIGLSAIALEDVRQFLRHRHGMILVAGPKGSGTSTTLAAALRSMPAEKTNIVTVEDPVEYRIPGVNQTQLNETIGLTLASALRSILGQDPDVILVSEISDAETAHVAMQAACTGHLVLSTLRTDDAASVITRLIDVGVEPDAIAGSLVGVVAQRLVRRLCAHCRRQYTPPPGTLRALNVSETDGASFVGYEAVGCDHCNHTGYRGRIGIYEVLRVTDKLTRLIAAKAAEDRIRDTAMVDGMVSLGEDGLAKVKSGITSADELLRVVTDLREARTLCRECGTAVGVDFRACPNCGTRIGGACPHCGRALQPRWNFCPYCARTTESPKAPKRPGDRAPRGAGERSNRGLTKAV